MSPRRLREGEAVAGTRDDPEVSSFVVDVMRQVLAKVDDLADQMVADIRDEVPSYARFMDDFGTEIIRTALSASTSAHLTSLTTGQSPDRSYVMNLEALAARPAALGISHDDLIQSLWVGFRRNFLFITEQAMALATTRRAVEALAGLLLDVTEFIREATAAVSRGYLAYQSEHANAIAVARRDLIEDLLAGVFNSDSDMADRARQAEWDPSVAHGLVVLVSAGMWTDAVRRLRRVKAAIATAVDGAIDGSMRSDPSHHGVLFIPARTDRHWQDAVQKVAGVTAKEDVPVAALVADPAVSATMLHSNYQDAVALVTIVRRLGRSGVVRAGELDLDRLLCTATIESADLVDHTIGPILALPPTRATALLETLNALWDFDGRVSDAAVRLHLTEKAVRYRLEQIHKLTGQDPLTPNGRLRLDLARRALRVLPDAATPDAAR